MSRQNIYDNDVFFEGYKKIRENECNYNKNIELPAILSLLPNLKNKKVLDLGCGYGEHCKIYLEKGAKRVVGIDISKKMIDIAKLENKDFKIEYMNVAMEEIDSISEKFDLVASSLAFHYVEDFEKLLKNIYDLLFDGGILIFSQEHPLVSSHSKGDRWTKDSNGNKIYANISNYSIDGKRNTFWFVDDVKKYHRTFSTIINTLIKTGFKIENILEPIPSVELIKKCPQYVDSYHRPDFLIIKVSK